MEQYSKLITACAFSLLLFGKPACVSGHCPDDWTQFQDSCYHFARDNSTFTEAEHYCKQHGQGSHLVHVESATESAFLKSHLSQLKGKTHWIGLTDRDIESIWKWVDTQEPSVYTNWAPIEPNSKPGENCVTIREDHAFKWADENCGAKYPPICEKSVLDCSEIVG